MRESSTVLTLFLRVLKRGQRITDLADRAFRRALERTFRVSSERGAGIFWMANDADFSFLF